MKEFVEKFFITMVALFLFFLYQFNSDRIYYKNVNGYVAFLLFIAVIAISIWVSFWIDKKMNPIPNKLLIQSITGLLILVYFTYLFFTPYFYTNRKLEEIGVEKVKIYYQLSDTTLDENIRLKLAEKCLTKDQVRLLDTYGKLPSGELVDVKVTNIQRNYYSFNMELLIQSRENEQNLKTDATYTFTWELWDLKIAGFSH